MKGFVFSLDSVIALLILFSTLAVAVTVMNTSYSSLKHYEVYRYSLSILKTLKKEGFLSSQASALVNGNQNQAESFIRQKLRSVFPKGLRERITLYVYNGSQYVDSYSVTNPKKAYPGKQDTIISSRVSFVFDDYEAIAVLQVW